ncbi:Fur family ferric uptake transcriptional regulator [Wenyingzhuangia heitensis]|uniref:Fur family ferric uptake transcriptional regulator n=1 Tax=Wenyingzhuangia heitensis TaxID=1487859 RepID=A0ABX0UHQ6_9FLAO|nr:transcriptional repressor [Wenyingzhuangia heitensis]NIJ46547.1 Fur family ferric uptake transcriptional regulator [Wenyingzhuangia heitensis]
MKRRSTPTKEAVLDVITKTGKAMSQDAIEKKINIDINRATIYRVLNRFCEDGVLHKVVAEDGKQYFALCLDCDNIHKSINHFHFRCVKCETIECLPTEVNFSIPDKYTVQNVNCVLTGTCKDCF